MTISPATRRVYDEFLAEYERNGHWPVRVRDLVGRLVSPGTVHTHLRILERAGLIEKGPGTQGWRPK